MMQTRTSVGIEEASISRDIQAHEDRKDQKKLVVQVIRTLLGGKMAQNDELDDHSCDQGIGIVTHIYFPHSYNNFEILEYFLSGTGRTVPSDRVISKRRMDLTKNGFTIKHVWIMAIFGTIAVFLSGPVTFSGVSIFVSSVVEPL